MKAISYSENVNDPYGHNKGYEQEGKGNQVGKDGGIIKNFGSKDKPVKDSDVYEKSKDVYIRSLKEKEQDENEGNDEIM